MKLITMRLTTLLRQTVNLQSIMNNTVTMFLTIDSYNRVGDPGRNDSDPDPKIESESGYDQNFRIRNPFVITITSLISIINFSGKILYRKLYFKTFQLR